MTDTLKMARDALAAALSDLLRNDGTRRSIPAVNSAIAAIDAQAPQAAPVALTPLTDEQIDAVTRQQWGSDQAGVMLQAHRAYARAVLAAAGAAAPAPVALTDERPTRADLVAALQWYADGLHFDKASPDAWDTVSGEPQNWWCDEAGTATVEDGSIAAMVLRGELTGAQVQALDDDGAAEQGGEHGC